MKERSGFNVIPMPAKILAVAVFLITSYVLFFHRPSAIGREVLLIIPCGAFAAGYVLLTGYVYGDAAQRGMPPALWTALAVLVPNCIGFVLYFLLRKPMLHPCAACGCGIADVAYCPRCGQPQPNAGMQPTA